MLGPVYTEHQRQGCDNADAPDQFGIATYFWGIEKL